MVPLQDEQQELLKSNITEMIHRLKTRLALANFKRQYGYEKYDLYTLESNLLIKQKKQQQHVIKKKTTPITNNNSRHRYYPTHYTHSNSSHYHHHPHHPHYVSLPILSQSFTSSLYARYPLSEKRSTSPHQQHKSIIPATDEDAANVLVMLRNMPPSSTSEALDNKSSLCI